MIVTFPCLRCIDCSLIAMEYHLILWILFLQANQIIQTTQICHPVAPSGRKSVSENLVVPKIHVQGKLIVNTLHIESCHVTDNTLQGSVNLHFAHEQVRIYLKRISGLLILVVFRLALYSENLAAFVRIRI